jgi:hypothetical protein
VRDGSISSFIHGTLIIDIEEDLDERESAAQLEQITKHLKLSCIFTVCQNVFSALENLEITDFDLILIADKFELCNFEPFAFLRAVRNIGLNIPVVLLLSDTSSTTLDGFPVTGFNRGMELKYSATLPRPYTRGNLCNLISTAFQSPNRLKQVTPNSTGGAEDSEMTQIMSPSDISPIPTPALLGLVENSSGLPIRCIRPVSEEPSTLIMESSSNGNLEQLNNETLQEPSKRKRKRENN